jgi:hypothetical protein
MSTLLRKRLNLLYLKDLNYCTLDSWKTFAYPREKQVAESDGNENNEGRDAKQHHVPPFHKKSWHRSAVFVADKRPGRTLRSPSWGSCDDFVINKLWFGSRPKITKGSRRCRTRTVARTDRCASVWGNSDHHFDKSAATKGSPLPKNVFLRFRCSKVMHHANESEYKSHCEMLLPLRVYFKELWKKNYF